MPNWQILWLGIFHIDKFTSTEFQSWTGLQEHMNSERVELGAQCIHGGEMYAFLPLTVTRFPHIYAGISNVWNQSGQGG